MPELDDRLRKVIQQVKGKRPRTVIDHILKHGFITTQEIRDTYGYNHPPRAARDVREEGVPLVSYRVKGSDGRMIGAYRFGNPDDIEMHKLGGRKTFSKVFKKKLIEHYGPNCAITGEKYNPRYLQIDHRIPYEIAGDNVGNESSLEKFMLLSGASQRQKSWSCEHCPNFIGDKEIKVCQTCYWASPEEYDHIAIEPIRQVELVWLGEEIQEYEKLSNISREKSASVQLTIKEAIRSFLNQLNRSN